MMLCVWLLWILCSVEVLELNRLMTASSFHRFSFMFSNYASKNNIEMIRQQYATHRNKSNFDFETYNLIIGFLFICAGHDASVCLTGDYGIFSLNFGRSNNKRDEKAAIKYKDLLIERITTKQFSLIDILRAQDERCAGGDLMCFGFIRSHRPFFITLY